MTRLALSFAVGAAVAIVALYAAGQIALGDSLLLLVAIAVGLLVVVASCAADVRDHTRRRERRQRL